MKRATRYTVGLGLVRVLALSTLLVSGVSGLAGGQEALVTRAFELERRGKYAEAADAYRLVLLEHPTDAAALLGLERSLLPLGRLREILPRVNAALAADSTLPVVYGIGVRAWSELGDLDSLETLVERWIRIEPNEEAPYRDWGRAALRLRDRKAARAAYLAGRQRLGRPGALAAELAQLAAIEGNYAEASREWANAVHSLPGYRNAAQTALGKAPTHARPLILRTLTDTPVAEGRELAANLHALWGEPLVGLELLEQNLSGTNSEDVAAYRQFLELLRGQYGDDANRARARILEAIAQRTTGPQNARLRLEAARSFAEGGDAAAARRMLAGLAEDESAPPDLATGATLTLITILVAEGKLDEAEQRLTRHENALAGEDVVNAWRDIALRWIAAGDLDRAEAAIAHDSSVEGLAVAGKIRLFRGDLGGAFDRLEAAGPYAGSHEEAAARTALLALIQPMQSDSLPDLGRGLLALERGDTAAALDALIAVAERLPAGAGGAEVYLLAARIEAARGRTEAAERLFRVADNAEAPATAPAAELELARLLTGLDRFEEAIETLEHLIITYADSALVPQARRLLDEVRGAVPRT